MCRDATGDRSWMAKVRPMWGHNYHFHVRIACPEGEATCVPQEPVGTGDGCDASLAWWFRDEVLHPRLEPRGEAETAHQHGPDAGGLPPGPGGPMTRRSPERWTRLTPPRDSAGYSAATPRPIGQETPVPAKLQ